MQFAIVNESEDKKISYGICEQIGSAIERQLYEHYAPFWESSGAPIKVFSKLADVPKGAALVVILDSAPQGGYLGYHDVTPDGRPYARVFWQPIVAAGGTLVSGPNSLSVTLSHEILETIGDPYANFWAEDTNTGLLHALELCDACEAESYVIDAISVSNFVGPRFFDSNGEGPYDWLANQDGIAHIQKPFDTLPGGYQVVAKNMDHVTQIWGSKYPDWKKELKANAIHGRKVRRLKRKGVILDDSSNE